MYVVTPLALKECMIMSCEVYYVHARASRDVRGKVFLRMEGCLKAVLERCRVHGKSPCFSRCSFSLVFRVDAAHYFWGGVHGGLFLE